MHADQSLVTAYKVFCFHFFLCDVQTLTAGPCTTVNYSPFALNFKSYLLKFRTAENIISVQIIR